MSRKTNLELVLEVREAGENDEILSQRFVC
jgi:hypothetical protein